jgi:predicted Zn-dependent protease
MRIVRLIWVLVVTWVLSTGCSTVPETGRSRIMLVSAAEETEMGRTAFAQIKLQEPISNSSVVNKRVRRVGERIAYAVNRSVQDMDWEFVVFESEALNAFALPGGKVGVYTGLLALTESDDELACIIGHEIAHVTSRHGAERISQQLALTGVVAVGEWSMEEKEMDEGTRNMVRAVYGIGSTLGYVLPFSRLHESEADAVGLKFAASAGYNPKAAINFWRKMKAAHEGSPRSPEWMSTHPSHDTRITNLERLAEEYRPIYEAANPLFDAEAFDADNFDKEELDAIIEMLEQVATEAQTEANN